jgi:tRNA(fMet)-specific endonuclease VapC
MTILDTTVMIALLNGSADAVEKVRELLKDSSPVVTTIITAYELLKGASLSSKRQENLIDVKEAISNIQVLDLTTNACVEASNIFCNLRGAGRLISEFDILIAAIAKTNNEAILTHDKHFREISGLKLIKW